MKTICFLLLSFVPVYAIGQSNLLSSDILKAEVFGDSVILRDDTAYRNCGAWYTMEITGIDSNTLRWVQRDYGSVTYCHCHFNLSVTIDSLHPGGYTVIVNYTVPESGYLKYVGRIYFTITGSNSYSTPSILSQVQSNCFIVGTDDPVSSSTMIKIFPNPVNDILTVSTELKGDKTIMVSDLAGKCLLWVVSDKNQINVDLSMMSNQMYILTVTNNENVFHAKVIKK